MNWAPRHLYELAARLITEVDQVNKINFLPIRWYASRIFIQFHISGARYDLNLFCRVIDRIDRFSVRRPDLNVPFLSGHASIEREFARAYSAFTDCWR